MEKKLNTPESFWPSMEATMNADKPTQQTPGTTKTNTTPQHTDLNINKMENNSCNTKRKVISKALTIANGSAVGTYEKEANFGTEYKRCIGYYIVEKSLANLTSANIKVGISDGTRTILEKTPYAHFTASTSVPIKDRFNREECIVLPAGKLIAQIEIDTLLTSDLEVHLVAILERD